MVRPDVTVFTPGRQGLIRAATATAILALAQISGAPAHAEAPRLGLPIDCTFGVNCYIQQYVDTDPSDEARDFRGGLLSYQNHGGTDFALLTRHQMRVGVSVLAAADGRVDGVRNDMEDGQLLRDGRKSIKGKDCGNAVKLDHGDGWVTLYCHLKKGSVSLRKGQLVRAGQKIGLVGMSGLAQFPHVHISVFQGKFRIDPFTGKATNGTCNRPDCNHPLWHPSTARTLAYRPGGLIDGGFSDTTLSYEKIKEGTAKQNRIGKDAKGILLFAFGYGSRSGDVLTFEILAPGATKPLIHHRPLKKIQAQFAQWFHVKRPGNGWPKGVYQGKITMQRAGRILQIKKSKILIR